MPPADYKYHTLVGADARRSGGDDDSGGGYYKSDLGFSPFSGKVEQEEGEDISGVREEDCTYVWFRFPYFLPVFNIVGFEFHFI
jgi:hypothetical protein